MTVPSLATMLVGSYTPPSWLVDTSFLRESLPQRVPNSDLWRVEGEDRREAVDDAAIAAAVEQVSLGLDVITDGEIRRQSYSERFSNALAGIDRERPGTAVSRTGAVVEPDAIAHRVAEALECVPASRLALSPDCGMKYLPRRVAMAKLRAMVGAAERMRDAGA